MDMALSPPHGPIWHGATVLVVDDQPQVRGLLRRMLEAEGFHVEEAPDGASALTLIQARAEPFDLVLTDLSMPHIDGRQVSETLARYRPSVALLCMSADPDAVPYIESSDTPVRVLLKPFTPDDLYHAVRDAITRATDLAVVAEAEIVQAHSGLSKLASAIESKSDDAGADNGWSSPLESCGGLPPAPMTEPPARPLLLLVDDDPVVRLTLARALTERGLRRLHRSRWPGSDVVLAPV